MVLAVVIGACSNARQPADSGITDASSGSVTFHYVVPSSASFCDQWPGCPNAYAHLRIRTAAGEALRIVASSCWGLCSPTDGCGEECYQVYCPPQGVAVITEDLAWNGRHDVPSACGADCLVPTYAPPGPYTAQLCATPGTLTPADGGALFPDLATCTNTGPEVCGPTVPFTFPSATPVELPLVADDGG
jgi:hypothetical protein